jgi:biotin operon repressor
VAELDDVEMYRTKHQHLCTSFCQIKIAEQRNLKNQMIIKNIQDLKAQGIL